MRETFLLKLAVSLKTHMMVKNALDLHFQGRNINIEDTEPTQSSTSALALLNYNKASEKTETVGGLWWCWKGYITKSLIHQEGVIVNSRLILCNALQFFTVIALIFIADLTATAEKSVFRIPTHELEECNDFVFDPDKCSQLKVSDVNTGMAVCYGITSGSVSLCVSSHGIRKMAQDYFLSSHRLSVELGAK